MLSAYRGEIPEVGHGEVDVVVADNQRRQVIARHACPL
jgi:hypothetical protein